MQERCKNAAKLIDDFNKTKALIQLPFVLRASEKPVRSMRQDSKLSLKSPLAMSDRNVQFLSQASLPGCRDAVLGNPLRNISGKLFQVARNVGADIVDMSLKIQRHLDIEREKESILSDAVGISNTVISKAQKKVHCSSQTDDFQCQKCKQRSEKKFNASSAQTDVSGPPIKIEEEAGSFNVNLNAQTMKNLNENQQKILLSFVHAFNISDSRFGTKGSSWSDDDSRSAKQEPEDRMSYTNPENPNVKPNSFISFSPVREKTASRSPPPRRPRIVDRLGEKVPSPRELRRRSEDRLSPYMRRSPGMRRSPSDSRRSPRPLRRRDEGNFSAGRYFDQAAQYSYRIPTPAVVPHYSRDLSAGSRDDHYRRVSPFSSNGHRNRSPSPSPVRSPPRSRQRFSPSPDSHSMRRGRY